MAQLITPHCSEQLMPLLFPETERPDELRRAETLRRILLDSRAVSDVLMLAMGAYTPLGGFMGYDDWRGSCLDMKTSSGVFWPIPIIPAGGEGNCRQYPYRGRCRACRQ